MPITRNTYSEISQAANEVREKMAANEQRLLRLQAEITAIVTSNTAIANEYANVPAAADLLLAQNPTAASRIWLRGHVNELLADFQDMRRRASELNDIINQ